MQHFIQTQWGTVLVAVVLVAVILIVIFRFIKNKKAGKSSCGCDCGSCPGAACCHKKPPQE